MDSILELKTKNFKNENSGVILIPRIKRKNLSTFIELQDKLLYRWVAENLSVGNIVCTDDGWDLLCKTASLISTLDETGNESPLDLEQLEDADFDFYHNLTRLFFTASVDDEDYEDPNVPYKPSLLAKFNQLNHGGALGKQVKKLTEKQNQEATQTKETKMKK